MTVQDIVDTLTKISALSNRDVSLLEVAILFKAKGAMTDAQIAALQATLSVDFGKLKSLVASLP